MFSSMALRVGFVVLSSVCAVACAGADGAPGANGESVTGPQGAEGADGTDGADGKDGLNGADGKDGVDGLTGADGKDGVDGKDAPVLVFGQFLPSQVAGGLVVTCATTNAGAATVECRGMKVNGLDVYLGPSEANALCAGITGNGYDTASGLGIVPAPWMSMSTGKWTVASAGSTSPMQNLTCKR